MMLSKKLFGVLAAAALSVAGCSTSGGDGAGAPEHTASAKSPQVASLACTPLFATETPLLSCGGIGGRLGVSSEIQAQFVARMQAAFTNLTLAPDFEAGHVTITSAVPEFGTFFGPSIVAPLLPTGAFTTLVPFTAGEIVPHLGLTANIFGTLPGLCSGFGLGFGGAGLGLEHGGLALEQGGLGAFNSIAFNAAAMPLTFLISTPFVDGLPLACNGAFSLGCL